ncbi:SDR family oxidoreductase [Novosphingobium tardum]|uniref:SDR family oxidoreductase n=1 Tax=Novosphingobium tardum TaxID=1538021 RepID=A0ABV8RQY4_9SPHN
MNSGAGKVAIVTGASKGMGRHFVDALVGQGWQVAALARPSAELDLLGAAYGDKVIALSCDVSASKAVADAVAETVARFGRLDLVVNNAAAFEPFLLDSATDAQIEGQIALNLTGVIWMMRAAIPHLKASFGQIVTISSESVSHPFPMLGVYAATKAAVEALSAGLREELRGEGVRVSVLRSGSVAGSTASAAWDPAVTQEFYRRIVASGHAAMSGEPATPESMAQALLAMISLPPDVSADLVEVRAARSGLPAGAKAL